jgi:tetratricopeptide (TPR) repeat protein
MSLTDERPFGPFFFMFIFLVTSGFLMSGCGQSRQEEALQTARTLMSTGGLSDTEAVRYLETSDELLERLASVKIRAQQNRLYVLEKLTNKYENMRMWPEAAESVDKLVRLQPTEIRWHLAEGRIHSQWSQVDSDHVETAEEAFRTALELDSDSLEAMYGLGVLLAFRAGEPSEGREYLARVADHTPVNVHNREIIKQARFALGRFYYEGGNAGEAVQEFQRIVEMESISPTSRVLAYRNLARSHIELGNRGRARDVLKSAYDLQPYNSQIRGMLRELGVDIDDRYNRFD